MSDTRTGTIKFFNPSPHPDKAKRPFGYVVPDEREPGDPEDRDLYIVLASFRGGNVSTDDLFDRFRGDAPEAAKRVSFVMGEGRHGERIVQKITLLS